MKQFFPIALLFMSHFLSGQVTTEMSIIYSNKVRDSFELYVSTPQNIDHTKIYDVVYYCDANLKSGKKLRELIHSTTYQEKVSHTMFVGVGHIGNFHILRRRDFILPVISKVDTLGRSENYGQIEQFYQFLKTELIPAINAGYKTQQGNNAIVGHSLGGLFAFYCLFKNESVFKNYFALSPALWIDHYAIYDFNRLNSKNNMPANLYFSTGGLEVINHIRKGTNSMNRFLNTKKYPNLIYQYQIQKGKTHNSQVEKSLEYILR